MLCCMDLTRSCWASRCLQYGAADDDGDGDDGDDGDGGDSLHLWFF